MALMLSFSHFRKRKVQIYIIIQAVIDKKRPRYILIFTYCYVPKIIKSSGELEG